MKKMKNRRVLMITENQTFPQDIRVYQESVALADAGYRVSVICPKGARQPWYEIYNNVHIYRYPAPIEGKNFLSYIFEYVYSLLVAFLLSLLVWMRHGFDILHSANPPDTMFLIAAFYKVFGKKYIFDHHDLAPEMYWEKFEGKGNRLVRRLLIWMEILSCRIADRIIATNQSYKLLEAARARIPEDQITVIRNGPNLERFRSTETDENLRARGHMIIGYVGFIAYQDGLDYLLRALHLLKTQLGRDDFYCVIIGKGTVLSQLKKLSAQLGLENHVWFTGFIPEADMLRYLSTADICVDPDPSNPFNDRCTMIKMMEYMALGKPIVAFDLPEHRVTAGNAALYAHPNDELEFARKLCTLMDDAALREKMGNSGYKRVVNELAWVHQKKHLIDTYETLLQGTPG